LALLGALVHGFYGLEGEFQAQERGALTVYVVLAISDEFDHAEAPRSLVGAGKADDSCRLWYNGCTK
jgi:hypothetical protein